MDLHNAPRIMVVLDVLDLPQLYTKPSSTTLLDTLALLASAPPSWDLNAGNGKKGDAQSHDAVQSETRVNPEGVPRYLTSIVSNSLSWIPDDEVKEEIWNQASLRLSERSGRTAMGDILRKFQIASSIGSFELSIHEPALTGDDLGLKTWAASYLLAKRLHTFDLVATDISKRLEVLELGSGTGLVGLAMAALGADVVLTDLPSICTNLARNAQTNDTLITQHGGSTRTAVLDWTHPASCELWPVNATTSESITTKFPLILAADSLYSPDHPRMLVDTIDEWLSKEVNAKVIVEFPYRDAYLPEIQDFRQRMIDIGLHILAEGEETGYDDWAQPAGVHKEQDESALVTCWWSCWGRSCTT